MIIRTIQSRQLRLPKNRRSLGVGFIGLAHYLAKLGYDYDSQEAWDAVHSLSESFQYFLLKSSNEIAKEKGHCEYFGRTKYSDGILLSTPTRRMLMRSVHSLSNTIGNRLESRFWLTDYGTQHCLLRCHLKARPLCQTQQMESSHLETICPLRRVRKDPLSRLYRLTQVLKTITHFSGT